MFHDIVVAGARRLSLRTIAQSRETLAGAGAPILLEQIELGDDEPPRRVRLPPLVLRSSRAAVA